MLLAILLGNLVYFELVPHLPEAVAHDTFHIDAGLFLDLAICALLYLIVRRLFERPPRKNPER